MLPPHTSTVIIAATILVVSLMLYLTLRGSKCERHGHIPNPGYGRHYNPINSGEGYFEVKLAEVDGIGTQHARLITECERCGKKYQIGRIHVPQNAGRTGRIER